MSEEEVQKTLSQNAETEKPMMEPGQFCLLLNQLGYTCKPLEKSADGTETIEVKPEELLSIAKILKEDAQCSFEFLVSISGVDQQDHIKSVYHLVSYKHLHKLILKVPVTNKSIPSVASVWNTANWHEREAYDLFGIDYTGHPDLKRILLPNDWIGHPLRKDYKNTDQRLVWNER